MPPLPLAANLYDDLQKLGTRYAGAYLVNKFFIRVVTNAKKSDIPSYDYEKQSFSDEDQMKLQRDNYPTLFHEYIHYIHEVSTMAGITQFYLNIFNRAIFSEFVQLPETSEPLLISGERKILFDKVSNTLQACTGGSIHDLNDRVIFRIDDVIMMDFDAYEPSRDISDRIQIPMVIYSYHDEATQSEAQDSVFFGKYFLYEGMAHHLDQIVTSQLKRPLTPKQLVRPEYKILEMVANSTFRKLMNAQCWRLLRCHYPILTADNALLQ